MAYSFAITHVAMRLQRVLRCSSTLSRTWSGDVRVIISASQIENTGEDRSLPIKRVRGSVGFSILGRIVSLWRISDRAEFGEASRSSG